jgi:hypothetical protein
VSRFRRALAATALAVGAAGGALLTATAGAAPAYAAAGTAPAGGHAVTLTVHATKQASAGTSPQVILPCAVPASASPSQVKPASCGAQTITCWITVPAPALTSFRSVVAGASVHCDAPVSAIRLGESLYKNNGGSISDDQDDVVNEADAHTAVGGGACQPVPYDNFGFAGVDFPDGYTPTTGSLHHLETFTPTASACAPPPPPGGGGGGGGGCAITAPSSTAQPLAVRPRLITCQ